MIYLLQRAKIRRPLVVGCLSEAVKFDYMGSAEFEFHALPTSLRAMEAARGELKLVTFPEVSHEDGRQLRGFGVFDEQRRDAYEQAIRAVAEGKRRCKEMPYLNTAANPSKNVPPYACKSKLLEQEWREGLPDFWWDIENHVMLSFNKVFMKRLPQVLRKSWEKMHLV